MLVTLIGKNVLYKLILPHKKTGNYWITNRDNEKNLETLLEKIMNGTYIVMNKPKSWIQEQ